MRLLRYAGIGPGTREQQTRFLSQAIQLEEAVNPSITLTTMTMISLAIVAFVVWAGFTNINEVARTPGEIVPFGYEQTVQHLEGGIISNINVHEGDVVVPGQILVSLSDASIREDLARAESRELQLQMQVERLRAFLADREPDFSVFENATEAMIADQAAFFDGMRAARRNEATIIREQIGQKEQAILSLEADIETAREGLRIATDLYDRRSELSRKGYASEMQVLEESRSINDIRGRIRRLQVEAGVAEREIEEFRSRLTSLASRHRDEANVELAQVLGDLAQNEEIIDKLEERIGRLQVRAPSRGLVKGLAVNTVGAVVAPGQTIMQILPLDKQLEVQVKIAPKDIGHLQVGQPVQVKFSSFDFSRYGSVPGHLAQVSATTFSGAAGERYYLGRVLLDRDHVGANTANKIMPGMTVTADIVTGNKTILQYLLKPIHLSLNSSFNER